MSKNRNTYAKRKREMDKKMKADEKRARRKKRKEEVEEGEPTEVPVIDAEEYEPAAPDAVYPDPIFVRLTRLEVSGYSW